MNLPNKISLSRIFLIPIVVFFYLATFIPYGKLVAALVFAIAAITDNVDGRIARKRNMVTDLGKFLDTIADKVLVMSGLLLIIAFPVTGATVTNALPAIWPAWAGIICGIIILARELLISAFRQIAATKNLVMAADRSGKIKAFFQDVTIFLYMIYAFIISEFNYAIPKDVNAGICIGLLALLVATTLLTVISGIHYIVKNGQVLKSSEPVVQEIHFDPLIGDVLNEFVDDGYVSEKLIAERFDISQKRANKIVNDMVQLGYVSDEGEEREILISVQTYQEIFGKR